MIHVCALTDLPRGAARRLPPTPPVSVFHTTDGELYAIDDTCTHQDASLADGWLEGCEVECPLHAAIFDLRTGEPDGLLARRPVRTHAVHVLDGVVHVGLRRRARVVSGPRVVVIGAGVVGAAVAVADELTSRGWTDVTVLDRGELPLPGGSSSHAPGLVFRTNPAKVLSDLARTTVEKLSELGVFDRVGGPEVAITPERLADLRRRHGLARSWGIPSRLVDADECAALHPLLPPGAVLGGLHAPTDGLAAAPRAVAAQLERAVDRGARVLGRHRVTDVRSRDGRVTAVVTDRGEVPADVVVSATGFWGPQTGALVDLTIPLLPMAHQYARTGPVAALAGATAEASAPILRHQDRDLYFREHGDRVGIGSYAHRPMPVDVRALADGEMPSVLDFTPEDFAPSWDDAVALLPDLAAAGLDSGFNGIFSFTPDGMPLIGEHPGLRGFWVAEAVWVTHSCGVGRALARWLVEGEPGVDVHACDLNRFDAPRLSPEYVATRSARNFVEVYDVIHPLDPPREPRPLRVSPWYARQVELGAVFGEGAGWERPLWFGANAGLPEVARIPGRGEWASRHWSPVAGAEALVARERAALFDMTPLVRLDVTGLAAPDLTDEALGQKNGGGQLILLQVFGGPVGTIFLVAITVAITVCALAVHTAAIRLMFAMARDNVLPAGALLARIDPVRKTPVVPAVVVGVLALVVLVVNAGVPEVFTAVTSVAIIMIYIAYLLVTVPMLRRRLRGEWPDAGAGTGYFSLGRLGLPVNVLAVLWGVAMALNLAWPREEVYGAGWLSWIAFVFIGVVALGGLAWYLLRGRHHVGTLPEHLARDLEQAP